MDEMLNKEGSKIIRGEKHWKWKAVRRMDWRDLAKMVTHWYGLLDKWFGCKGGILELRFGGAANIDDSYALKVELYKIGEEKSHWSQHGQGTERAADLLMDVEVTENDDRTVKERKKESGLCLLMNEGEWLRGGIMTSRRNEWWN